MSPTERTEDVRSADAAAEPAEWQRFESLLVELSAGFVNLPAHQVDAEITRWLQRIVQFLDIDRSTLWQYAEDLGDFRNTHSWAASGFPPTPKGIGRQQLPWAANKILCGEAVVFSRVDDLPSEAERDKECK